jgi:hypothetical protein
MGTEWEYVFEPGQASRDIEAPDILCLWDFLRTGYHHAARRFQEERTTEIQKGRTSNIGLLKRGKR